ncbi:hypothetical protein FSW04_09700 [Baekduia soli]|uniref:Uncharacterized protein n=1 Tax=Baekduia soli TaxID=496014 RepID=A0A5B8U429_9ACTN|nr:hypothetical protein [Baekduia soli]QEC47814.1 hypothetical protein FSW04_09700 [Baekduia soli]
MSGDFDLLAASLRADARDVDGFFDVLVAKLGEVFPDGVEIERGGLLGRSGPKAVAVTLGDRRYEAERARRTVVCRRRTVVRGIALKSEDLDVDAWIDALSADLVDEAARSERARVALEELLNP